MNQEITNYCYLCAALKPGELQVDLKTDTEERDEVMRKLSRINSTVEVVDQLSLTVCLECLRSLAKAYDFVVGVEATQKVIRNLISQHNVRIVDTIKREKNLEFHGVSIISESNSDEEVEEASNSVEILKDRKKTPLELPLSQQKSTWAEAPWQCSYCDLSFTHVDDLKVHSMSYHNACNAYRCTDCNYICGILDKFLDHMKKHHLLLPYSCYKCYKKFSTIKEARKHEQEHLERHLCQGCNIGFKDKEEQQQHQETYFKIKVTNNLPKLKEYKCDICSKILKCPKGLIAHKLLHTERKPSYKCEVCGKGFFERSKLARHSITHSDNRPYRCDKCDMSFKTNQQLQRHVTIHSNEKPFICLMCGQSFRHSNLLSAHKKVHTEVKLNQCPYCNKCFKYRRALNVHIGTHKQLNEYIPIESVEVTINEDDLNGLGDD